MPKLTFEQFQATGVAVPDLSVPFGADTFENHETPPAGRVYTHPDGDCGTCYIEEHHGGAPLTDGWYCLVYNDDIMTADRAAAERFLFENI